jgi:ankyrin repeat protein
MNLADYESAWQIGVSLHITSRKALRFDRAEDSQSPHVSHNTTHKVMSTEEDALALHLACAAAHKPDDNILEALLKVGAEVNAADCAGRRPLHYAAANGQHKAALLLLSHGADVECARTLSIAGGTDTPYSASNCYGSTALHLAAAAGHTSVVELLIAAGAGPDVLNHGGWTALAYAERGGEGFRQCATAAMLRARGAAEAAPPTSSSRGHVRPHPAALSPAGYR